MKYILNAFFLIMAISLFILCPVSSYADWDGHDRNGQNSGHHDSGHHDDRHHDHDYIGVNFAVWPDSYYYNGPYYPPADQVLVSSPVYQQVVINGITYYYNNGAYYVYNGYEYQAVEPPATIVQQPVTMIQPPAVNDIQIQNTAVTVITPDTANVGPDSITINVPNNKGSYTAVTLKRSGNGFLGPQGEFYPEFPTVVKLKVIYGN